MAELLPLIVHLQPPFHEMIKIRFARFSPYFNKAEHYGLTLAPLKTYQHVYPLKGQELFNIAYFFEQQSPQTTGVFSLKNPLRYQWQGHQALQEQISAWTGLWEEGTVPVLFMSDKGESIVIIDTRAVATNFTHTLTGLAASIYRLCAEPVSKSRLLSKLKLQDESIVASDVEGILAKLVGDNILLSLSNCYLALALVGETPALPDVSDYPAGYLDLS